MEYSVIVVANGQGTRMHLGYNKVFAKLEDGKTILEHACHLFVEDNDCVQVIIVCDEDCKELWKDENKIEVVDGGNSRQESVEQGLNHVTSSIVFVHDGARPYLEKENLESLKEAMNKEEAACLCIPVVDTLKKVEDNKIVATEDREMYMFAQTPQAFKTSLLKECMEKAKVDGFIGTDDCALVEKYSQSKIAIVLGNDTNKKITFPEHLEGK